MAVFNIDEAQGVWFDYPGGGRVQFRVASPEDWRRIRKATVKREPFVTKVDGKAQLFERDIVDEDLQVEMINDSSIVAWEGFLDAHGEEIPCTSEYKKRLMLMRDGSFRDFANEKIRELAGIMEGEQEVAEKNLSTGQNGKTRKAKNAQSV